MGRVLLVQSLSLHALEQHPLDIWVSHGGDVEERVEAGKVPRLDALPHGLHGCWPERDEVGKGVLEEEGLMALVVVAADEAGLGCC